MDKSLISLLAVHDFCKTNDPNDTCFLLTNFFDWCPQIVRPRSWGD